MYFALAVIAFAAATGCLAQQQTEQLLARLLQSAIETGFALQLMCLSEREMILNLIFSLSYAIL